MWDEGPIEIKKIKFTDYDTVMFPGKKEMTNDQFFTFFEKQIKKNKITKCSYNMEYNEIRFRYKKCDYVIHVENTSSGKMITLLNLINHEESLRKEKEYQKEREKYQQEIKERHEKLLVEARCGNIQTEEVRQLYLQELRENLTIKGKIKKILEIRKQAKKNSFYDDSETSSILFCAFLAAAPLAFGIMSFVLPYTGNIIVGSISILIGILSIVDIFKHQSIYIGFIFNFIKGIVTSNLFSNKMIKHKIQYLKKVKFPSNDDVCKKANSFSEPLKTRLSLIQEKLLKLNDDERGLFLEKITSKVNQLEEKISLIKNMGLMSEREEAINNEFSRYLDSFEAELDKLLDASQGLREPYAFTGKPRGMVLTSDGTKVKRK